MVQPSGPFTTIPIDPVHIGAMHHVHTPDDLDAVGGAAGHSALMPRWLDITLMPTYRVSF